MYLNKNKQEDKKSVKQKSSKKSKNQGVKIE